MQLFDAINQVLQNTITVEQQPEMQNLSKVIL